MKKPALILLMILTAAVLCAETHTITLVSRVEKNDATYAVRSKETGRTDASVIYSTEEIPQADVRTFFDILRFNGGGPSRPVLIQISATELTARCGGKTYSTAGVSIGMDGIRHGSSVSFMEDPGPAESAVSVVGSFDVLWPTAPDLVPAVYQAGITITATVL